MNNDDMDLGVDKHGYVHIGLPWRYSYTFKLLYNFVSIPYKLLLLKTTNLKLSILSKEYF
jgi:hypothetical protein